MAVEVQYRKSIVKEEKNLQVAIYNSENKGRLNEDEISKCVLNNA